MLPPQNAPDQVYKENVSWRYIFGFTFVLIVIGLAGFLCFIRNDSPKFYLNKGDEACALKSIHSIYKTEESDIEARKFFKFIEESCNKETVKVSFMESLWYDERYRRATIVSVILMSFNSLTGI